MPLVRAKGDTADSRTYKQGGASSARGPHLLSVRASCDLGEVTSWMRNLRHKNPKWPVPLYSDQATQAPTTAAQLCVWLGGSADGGRRPRARMPGAAGAEESRAHGARPQEPCGPAPALLRGPGWVAPSSVGHAGAGTLRAADQPAGSLSGAQDGEEERALQTRAQGCPGETAEAEEEQQRALRGESAGCPPTGHRQEGGCWP